MLRILKILFCLFILNTNFANLISAENSSKLLTTDWSFKGPFGKFDRASLQRGYQVYNEVCASCHSLKYVSYRNLSEKGGHPNVGNSEFAATKPDKALDLPAIVM